MSSYSRSPNVSPATLPHKSTATAIVPSPSARRKPSPEHLYTNENLMMSNSNNNNSGGRPASRSPSVSSITSYREEEQLSELHQAALVGKLLLDSNSKLRLELEQLKQEISSKNKEITWLKNNQESKREFYDEIDLSRQDIQIKYDQLKAEKQEIEIELIKSKKKVTFQEQRIAEVENQLKNEMVWNNWYTQESVADSSLDVNNASFSRFNAANSPVTSKPFDVNNNKINTSLDLNASHTLNVSSTQIFSPQKFPPSIAPIHQKMLPNIIKRSNSNPDLNSSRNLSADVACSQSRLDAEIEELTNGFFEDLGMKQKEIHQLSIRLDEQKALLARADHEKNELEIEKQALIAQIQKPSVREIEVEVTGNELHSIDAKVQQEKYDLARKKFDKILDSLEVEKQKIGAASSFTLSRSCSMRISPNKSSDVRQKLQRYNSVRQTISSSSLSDSLTKVTTDSSMTLDSYQEKPRANTFPIVPVISETSTSTETTETSSTPKSYSSVIETNTAMVLQSNDILNVIPSQEDELDDSYSVEEPEYKKLFQELFDIIHSVIPEDQKL